MKLLCSLAAAVAALVLTAPSQARTAPHHRWSAMTLTERRAVVATDAQRHRSVVRFWLRHRWRDPLSSSAAFPFCRALGVGVPGPVCVHGQRLVHDLALLRRIDARLAARAEAARLAAGPTHLAGWLCIHNGAYPGAPHEGNGWNPSHQYSGPLQMSGGWGGYPIYDWNKIPEMQVYEDAEAVAAAHGFGYLWMAGQWPNTFRPCASYFD